MATPSKKNMLSTPAGNERAASTVKGAVRYEHVVVLLGQQSKNIDFKKYPTPEEALVVFDKFKVDLIKSSKYDGDFFIEMPSGNLLRKSLIMVLEPILKPSEGIIVRDPWENIVDFLQVPGEENRQIVIKALKSAAEIKTPTAKVQPNWEELGIR